MDLSTCVETFQRERWENVEKHGSLTADCAAVWVKCGACGLDDVNVAWFSESEWDSLGQLRDRLPKVLIDVAARACTRCGKRDPEPEMRAWWGHWLPGSASDLVVELEATGDVINGMRLQVGPPDGPWKPIEWPADEDAFERATGTHFSYRQVWRDMVERGESRRHLEEDFWIGVWTAAGDDPESIEAVQESVIQFAREQGGLDVVVDLAAPIRMGFDDAGTYRTWLPGLAAELDDYRVLGFALTSSRRFLEILAVEADRRNIEMIGSPIDRRFPRLAHRPFELDVPALTSLAHGLSSGQGLHGCLRFLSAELELLRSPRSVLTRLSSLLAPFEVFVRPDGSLEVKRGARGKPERAFPVSDLVGEDLETFVIEVLQFDPVKRRFGPRVVRGLSSRN